MAGDNAAALDRVSGEGLRENQPEQALEVVSPWPGPPDPELLLAAAGDLEAACGRLQGLLQNRLDNGQRFRVLKQLARVLDRLERYSEVFTHLHRAAGLSLELPSVQAQDHSLIPGLIESYHETLDADVLARCARMGHPREFPPPVFLVGFPGSGARLVQEALDARPDVLVADEPDLISRLWRRIDPDPRRVPARLARMGCDEITSLRRAYWEYWREYHGGLPEGKLPVDKTVMNCIHLGLINCLFPDGKVVFMVRDPRDIMLECFLGSLEPSPETVHLFSWVGAAAYYRLVMEWWWVLRQRLTLTWTELRYEDAVLHFDETFRWLSAFLGLEEGRSQAGFSSGQVPLLPDQGSVGRWRCYLDEFISVRHLLADQIDEYGWRG